MLTQFATDKFEAERALSNHMTVEAATDLVLSVKSGARAGIPETHRVDLEERTCTPCGAWQDTGRPCRHVIKAADASLMVSARGAAAPTPNFLAEGNPIEYYDLWETQWKVGSYNKAMHDLGVIPPLIEALKKDGVTVPGLERDPQGVGRPSKRRRVASQGEPAAPVGVRRAGSRAGGSTRNAPAKSRALVVLHCSRCGATGHNSKGNCPRGPRGTGGDA